MGYSLQTDLAPRNRTPGKLSSTPKHVARRSRLQQRGCDVSQERLKYTQDDVKAFVKDKCPLEIVQFPKPVDLPATEY